MKIEWEDEESKQRAAAAAEVLYSVSLCFEAHVACIRVAPRDFLCVHGGVVLVLRMRS